MYLSLLLVVSSLPGAPVKADIPRLIEQLQESKDPIKQDKAARDLAALGVQAVPALTRALDSAKEGVSGRAARALRQIGPPAREAVPALIRRINKQKGQSPEDAEVIEALMRIAPRSSEAVGGLRAILREPPGNPCRIHAVVALGKMGADAKEAVPDLAKLLSEDPVKSGPTRFHAAIALGQIGGEAREAVPALVKLLKDKKAGPGRRTVVVALGQIGPGAKGAVDALKDVRGEPGLRDVVDKALEKIQGDR